MRILAALTTIVTITAALPARAEWTFTIETEEYYMFVDRDRVARRGDIAAAPIKIVPKADRSPFYSTVQINCRRGGFQLGEQPWSEAELQYNPMALMCIAGQSRTDISPVLDHHNGRFGI